MCDVRRTVHTSDEFEMDTPPSTSRYLLRSTTRSMANAMAMTSRTADSIAPLYEGNFGTYLTEQYDVLKMVLSYLNYHDLDSLRQVNGSLRKAANILLKKRCWIQCSSVLYVFKTDNWLPPAYDGHYVDLKIEPKVLFSFEAVANGSSCRVRPTICSRLTDKFGNYNLKADILPSSIEVFLPIGARGIIYPESNGSEMVFLHSSIRKKLALVYLPKSDNYDLTVFTHIHSQETLFQQVDAYFAGDRRPVRALIFLKVGTINIDVMIRYIVSKVTDNQSETFAVAGGHVSNLDFDKPPKKNLPGIFKAIIIRGSGIRCLSDIISASTPESVAEDLQVTANYVKNNFGKYDVNKTIILMFQCIDRYTMSTEDHIELAKTFPDIPVVGVQTWGEIGLRSFKLDTTKYSPKRKQLTLMHAYKTTYMILAID